MLRFGFLLLVATSALAAPGLSYAPTYENLIIDASEDIGVARNTGAANHLTDGFLNLFDGGESGFYTATLNVLINEIAAGQCRQGQALALSQALSGGLAKATGIPGDACLSAALINQYIAGNYRHALYTFIENIAKNLDILVRYRKNRQAARYEIGPVSRCPGGGRTYAFEPAWEAIIGSVTPGNTELLKEQYCTARRLYNSFNVLGNNIAAVVTATSLPPVAKVFRNAFPELANFVIALVENRNLGPATSAAKSALMRSL